MSWAKNFWGYKTGKMKKIVIIGGGINGLIAANYLAKEKYDVTVVEKKSFTGGACIKDSAVIQNKEIDFAYGATVLGMMPDFIFSETGLDKLIETFYPKTPKLVYFPDSKKSTRIFQNNKELDVELGQEWGEKGDTLGFRNDENKVINYIQHIYKNAISPSIEHAENFLGKDNTDLWVRGSAKDLLDHYFTSEKTKLYMGMTVIESGPASIYDPGTAFTIPLMDSGSVFNGYWGYVKNGIWKISENLTEINKNLGVKFSLNSNIENINTEKGLISYNSNGVINELNYDHLLFATDPKAPGELLNNETIKSENSKLNYLGSSGKVTAFFKSPVKWVESNKNPEYDTSFRFFFSNNTLEEFETASQNASKKVADYCPGYIQVYAEGGEQRKMNNDEHLDKIILFTKNLSFDKSAEKIDDVKEKIISRVMPHIKNPEDLVFSKFLTPKDSNETFYFPEGNIDHMTLDGNQNFDKRTFSSNANNFYKYYDFDNIYYCGAGSFPCGSVAGTPGYMCAKQLIRSDK